ncbi:hypothetical protein LINPERPRIM_LOCUS21671, partial [Linum perenne]
SSSSTSPPSRQPYTGKWEHDVFLCFRGDVRDSFVNHLELAMTDKKINYFIDTKLHFVKSLHLVFSHHSGGIVIVVRPWFFPARIFHVKSLCCLSRSYFYFSAYCLSIFNN